MKKILHYGISHNLGGIETYIQKIAKNIDKNLFHFDYSTQSNAVAAGFDDLENQGSKIFYLTPRRQNAVKNSQELEKIILENRYDIIHCHLLSLSYIAPVTIGIKHDIPIIIHSHSGTGKSSSLVSNALHELNKRKLKYKPFTAIAVSELAADFMFDNNRDVEIINNGIDTDIYKFDPYARKRIRNEFNIADDDLLITNVGLISDRKNQKFAIEVFYKLKEIIPGSKLLLVGEDGGIRHELTKLVRERDLHEDVIFTGLRLDIPDIYSASDRLIFPSHYEGFPGVVIEAQTSGLPCLISDTITDEVLIFENTKSLSLEAGTETWAKELIDLSSEADRRLAAQQIINSGLSVNDEINKLERIYGSLLRD